MSSEGLPSSASSSSSSSEEITMVLFLNIPRGAGRVTSTELVEDVEIVEPIDYKSFYRSKKKGTE